MNLELVTITQTYVKSLPRIKKNVRCPVLSNRCAVFDGRIMLTDTNYENASSSPIIPSDTTLYAISSKKFELCHQDTTKSSYVRQTTRWKLWDDIVDNVKVFVYRGMFSCLLKWLFLNCSDMYHSMNSLVNGSVPKRYSKMQL